MRRRDFIAGFGSAAALPAMARAQPTLPVVGFINGGSVDMAVRFLAAFRAGLGEISYVEGQNVAIEYHWLDGQINRVPVLVAELVRRRVAVIATPGMQPAALAAKAATTTIPIVFGVAEDPVRLGLVASLARPGGNATGMNFFSNEAVPKRLGLLHELVPTATRVAVLVNPRSGVTAEVTLRGAQDAADSIGLPIGILRASTSGEIEEAFATLVRDQVKALFVQGDGFFTSQRVQFVALAKRHGIAVSFVNREFVEAGGLMSYGTDLADMFHQVGVYTGLILKGSKPADLPVVQSTKFEFAINLPTARALGVGAGEHARPRRRGDRINELSPAWSLPRPGFSSRPHNQHDLYCCAAHATSEMGQNPPIPPTPACPLPPGADIAPFARPTATWRFCR